MRSSSAARGSIVRLAFCRRRRARSEGSSGNDSMNSFENLRRHSPRFVRIRKSGCFCEQDRLKRKAEFHQRPFALPDLNRQDSPQTSRKHVARKLCKGTRGLHSDAFEVEHFLTFIVFNEGRSVSRVEEIAGHAGQVSGTQLSSAS